ncbi:hypothetical protein C1645_820243 [Glomus cerebriforme]|uniref:Uncharacterized protein n=1 Tax=Glomus cerebriforme TaxID=658196 RepID=A0A397T8W0_9GLOM|nr:hypothetical protein C1645_820243 [Glomus cerebriforme]
MAIQTELKLSKNNNAVKLNINTLETIENEFNIDDINEININRTVFEQETFEINETDIGFDENSESNSEFDSFEREDEEILDNNDESNIIIEQKKSNNLTSCVLIDKIDGKIQRCKNKERKSIQVVCNGQYTFPALGECNLICKPALEDTKYSRYICSECYELEGGHFHVKPGKGKLLETCIDQKYHDEDPKKNLEIIARWLFYVKNNKNKEYQEKVLGIFLPIYLQFLNANYSHEINTEIVSNQSQSITTSSNTSHNFFIPTLLKLLTFFMVRVLTRLNQIPIYPDEKELEDDDFEKLGKLTISFLLSVTVGYAFPYFDLWLPTILSSLCRRPKLISSLHALLTKCSIIGHTSRHERRLEKARMKDIDPTKRLIRGNNVFNLAIIDNIDFKEVSFGFGNIYDVTHGTSYVTLRMVFQSTLPILTNETHEPVRELNVDTQLFGMTSGMHTMQAKIDQTFEKLLDFQIDINGNISYNKNLDVEIIEKEILSKCEFGCLIPPPNEVNQITYSIGKIRPILGGWHTSKDMLGVLLTIFSNYGIFHLATAIGVHFLDKLQAVVDYRSTRRVLELIWVMLEEKLQYCAFINLARKGHYPAFDEALEMRGVGYIKQNIIGNVVDQKNLTLQIQATQEERERIDTLLNEFLDPYNYDRNDRKVNNRIDPLWKLIENLVEIFQMDNYTDHELFKKNPPSQLTPEGLKKLSSAYNEGLKRIKEVYCQEVIKTEWINTKGRSHLEIVKTDIRSNPSASQSNKNSQQSSTLNDENPASKRQRIITTDKEKEILSPLLLKDTIPTETEINNVLKNLTAEWDNQRVKRYYNNNKMSKKRNKFYKYSHLTLWIYIKPKI